MGSGTIAMADLIQSEAAPSAEVLSGWAAKVAAHIKAGLADIGTDADDVLTHLLSMPYMLEGGREQYTIAQWIQVAAGLPGAPTGILNSFTDDAAGNEMRANAANSKLAKLMLRVIRPKRAEEGEPALFVGDTPVQGLKTLFQGTQWAGGAWSQSLRRVKGARYGRATTARKLAGIESRGVEIPLASIPGLAAFPPDRQHPEPAQAPGNTLGYGPEDYA